MLGCEHVLGLCEGSYGDGGRRQRAGDGRPADGRTLFVSTGAPAVRRAISDVFGSRGVVERCQVHRRRNLRGHLAERLDAPVGRSLRDGWGLDLAGRAARVLKRLGGPWRATTPARRRPAGRALRGR